MMTSGDGLRKQHVHWVLQNARYAVDTDTTPWPDSHYLQFAIYTWLNEPGTER